MLLYQMLVCTIHGKSYKNNRFKISAAALNDKFELSDRSYFVSDTQYLQ